MYISNVQVAHGTINTKAKMAFNMTSYFNIEIQEFRFFSFFFFLFFFFLIASNWNGMHGEFFTFNFLFYTSIFIIKEEVLMERLTMDGTHLTCHIPFLAIYTLWLIIIHIPCLHVSFFLRLLDVFARYSHTY